MACCNHTFIFNRCYFNWAFLWDRHGGKSNLPHRHLALAQSTHLAISVSLHSLSSIPFLPPGPAAHSASAFPQVVASCSPYKEQQRAWAMVQEKGKRIQNILQGATDRKEKWGDGAAVPAPVDSLKKATTEREDLKSCSTKAMRWRGGPVVKVTCYSSSGPELGSQQPCWVV